MAFCIKCGTDLLVDEARFCPMCGTPQPELSQLGDGARAPGGAAPAGDGGSAPSRPVTDQVPAPLAAEAADDEAFFAAAGSPLAGPGAAADLAPGRTGDRARAARPATSLSPNEAHLWRLGRGDVLAAAGCLAVILSLFVTWFSGTLQTSLGSQLGSLGRGLSVAHTFHTDAMGAGAWHWVVFLLAASLFVYLALRTLPGEGVILPVPHWQLLAVASGTLLVLVVLSVLLPPDIGSWSPSYGAVIGLVGAIVAFAGALVRRREPEVIEAPRAGALAAFAGSPRTAAPSRVRRSQRTVTRLASPTDLAPTTDIEVPPAAAASTGTPRTTVMRAPASAAAPAPDREPAPVPAQPADEAPPTAERRVPALQQRPATGTGGGPASTTGEVVCDVCSTVNQASAKVCRTCGVMLAGRRS